MPSLLGCLSASLLVLSALLSSASVFFRTAWLPQNGMPHEYVVRPTGARKNNNSRPKKRPSKSSSRQNLSYGIAARRSSAPSSA